MPTVDSKRKVEDDRITDQNKKRSSDAQLQIEEASDDEMGEFEDPFEDEFESEDDEVVIDDEEMALEDNDDDLQVYLPGQTMAEDEVLVADQSAYEMLHCMGVEWPCLSFDLISDPLGTQSNAFPMTMYLLAGSQADVAPNNKIYVMKISNLHKTKESLDEDSESDDDDALDEDPILDHRSVSHSGGVNRIRRMPHPEAHVCATMADTGKTHIYDLTSHVRALNTPGAIPTNEKPLHTITSHGKTEGYAIDWSTKQQGHLLTGDCASRIFLTTRNETSFTTQESAFLGHSASVEDLQWSPSQANVFASCSADQTIRIWDVRDKKPSPQLTVHAHESDVNVISWNRLVIISILLA